MGRSIEVSIVGLVLLMLCSGLAGALLATLLKDISQERRAGRGKALDRIGANDVNGAREAVGEWSPDMAEIDRLDRKTRIYDDMLSQPMTGERKAEMLAKQWHMA